MEDKQQQEQHLLAFPNEILENILSFLSHDEISRIRHVCRAFDKLCQGQLNQGFARVDKFHAVIQKEVKAQLPRRESERRNHPLARHVDILAAIETRLSLLSMTYMKYISMAACCFIPGKVLDEIYRVLRSIRKAPSPPRSHELLQELRDISSMAMEHFDEKIVPGIKAKMPVVQRVLNSSFPCAAVGGAGGPTTTFSPLSAAGSSGGISVRYSTPQPGHSSPALPVRQPIIRQEMLQIRQHLRTNSTSLLSLKRELRDCRAKVTTQQQKIQEQTRKLAQQDKSLKKQAKKVGEQDRLISDLSRKILEYDQKFVDVLSEISRVRNAKSGPGDRGNVDGNGNPGIIPSTSTVTDAAAEGSVTCGHANRLKKGQKRKSPETELGSQASKSHKRSRRHNRAQRIQQK